MTHTGIACNCEACTEQRRCIADIDIYAKNVVAMKTFEFLGAPVPNDLFFKGFALAEDILERLDGLFGNIPSFKNDLVLVRRLNRQQIEYLKEFLFAEDSKLDKDTVNIVAELAFTGHIYAYLAYFTVMKTNIQSAMETVEAFVANAYASATPREKN